MTERRRFNDRERAALYLAADGRCTECGAELEPGWHADHMNPHSKGGPTDVINGQALCPTCNLKKGARTVTELRGWQAEALEKFLRSDHDFLCVATPGAGKTRLALAAAERLLERGEVSSVVVVVPTAHLRAQWARSAHDVFGIELDYTFGNRDGATSSDFNGVVVTYASVAMAPLVYRRMSTRALVILDEVHHGGDDMRWGAALTEAFGEAPRRLLLSGTPDRTDGSPVPFVRYGTDRRFIADCTYDYGAALADRQGVVRQIAFPTFDGHARWLEAGKVQSELRLSEADEATRANAMRSALMPDGPWISSVLVAADKELSRQRELVSDAAGLVIAADQWKAAKYAKTLEAICGESVALAVSDVPDASDVITRFAGGRSRWLVAVAMVSEGVDIPRLVVGVYATNKATPLFFRQVVGRFVRTRGLDDDSCAALFIPSVEPLVGHAAEIERTIPRALKEAEERAEREAKEGGDGTLDIEIVVPLSPSVAVHTATIHGGESFADAELRKADEYARLAGMPGNVTPAQIARLMRVMGDRQTVATATIDIPKPNVADERSTARRKLNGRVFYLARLTDQPAGYVHKDLASSTGGGAVNVATLDQLRQRLVLVEQWIAAAKG